VTFGVAHTSVKPVPARAVANCGQLGVTLESIAIRCPSLHAITRPDTVTLVQVAPKS
jgi:hypothetical protein